MGEEPYKILSGFVAPVSQFLYSNVWATTGTRIRMDSRWGIRLVAYFMKEIYYRPNCDGEKQTKELREKCYRY